MGLKTISKLKKELDKWFSLYIRIKSCDDNGMVICYTSKRKYHYKNIHAGHFISRRHLSTRWLEQNVKPQSAADNLFGQGEQYKFGMYLDSEYGVGTAEQLSIDARKTIKMSRIDYEEKITYYKSVVNKIKQEKNIE